MVSDVGSAGPPQSAPELDPVTVLYPCVRQHKWDLAAEQHPILGHARCVAGVARAIVGSAGAMIQGTSAAPKSSVDNALITAVAWQTLGFGAHLDPDAEEMRAVTSEALKAWLDAMPIDDVQHKIEHLESKLSDVRTLARLYADRQPTSPAAAAESVAEQLASEPASAQPSAEQTTADEARETTVEDASPEADSPG